MVAVHAPNVLAVQASRRTSHWPTDLAFHKAIPAIWFRLDRQRNQRPSHC